MATLSNPLDVFRLAYLEALWVDLTSDGKPTIRGGTPSPELLVHLKEHRQTIIEELARQRIGEHDDGFNSPIRRRFVVPGDCLATKACARSGMCSEALRQLPCDHSTPTEATP